MTLRVIIIGNSLGGIITALALQKNGHEIHIFGSSQTQYKPAGDVQLPPNATSVLSQLGIDAQKGGAIPAQIVDLQTKIDAASSAHRWQSPWLLADASAFHAQIKAELISSSKEGRSPVRFHNSVSVVSVNSSTASIQLIDGTTFPGDVLIGADGVHFVARRAIADANELPSFVCGRMALIGEAAYPSLSSLGQDDAQVIEDAGSLSVMLGSKIIASEVPSRLELYNKARYERIARLQEFNQATKTDVTSLLNGEIHKLPPALGYAFSHDAIHSSINVLKASIWASPTYRQGRRQPYVFGPLVGPRQNGHGRNHLSTLPNSCITIATFKFKTSATYLSTLFPSSSYSFDKTDTVATASFSLECMDKLAWLGGEGYNIFAFYIHDVIYTQKNGKKRKGNYCPIMIENLTDPIVTGREELGVPKMFSDISVERDEESCVARVAWRGTEWARMELKNLEKVDVEAALTTSNFASAKTDSDTGKSEGLLIHKFIPATGDKTYTQADADYAVMIPYKPELSKTAWKCVAKAEDAKVVITNPDEEMRLPTLWPVAAALKEIPIFEVVEAIVEHVVGIPDLSNAERVD